MADSPRYLEYASALKNGFYLEPHNSWYFSYVLFCYVGSFIAEDSTWVLIAAQYILALTGVFAIYKTSFFLTSNHTVALIATTLFLVFPEVSQWNSYILPESVYISMTCLSLYLLARCSKEKSSFIYVAITLSTVLFTVFIKPTGFALPLSVLIVLIVKIWKTYNYRVIRWVLPIFLVIIIFPFLNAALATFQIMENYQKGEVIYDITSVPGVKGIEFLVINPPEDITLPEEERLPLVKILAFLIDNPVYSIKLFIAKLFYFFFHIRPYWSWFHNLFVLVYLVPLYYFFFKGLPHAGKEVRVFSISFIVLHALSIGLTSEDWDGRFLMPVLPVLVMIAAQGIVYSASRIIHSGEN